MRKMCRWAEVVRAAKYEPRCVCVYFMCSTPAPEQLYQPATHSAARKTQLGNEFQITRLAKMCVCVCV
jgi:hypothetical protein